MEQVLFDRRKFITAAASIGMATALGATGRPAAATGRRGDASLQFGSPMSLGSPARVAASHRAIITDDNVYLCVNGLPGVFYVIDTTSGAVQFSQPIPGSGAVWALAAGADGSVFISSDQDGRLWRFDHVQGQLQDLGTNPSNKFVWDLALSSDGKLFGATSSTSPGGIGKAFEYDITSASFTDLGEIYAGQQYVHAIAVTDGYVYFAIGTKKHLIRQDRATGARTEIQLPITGGNGNPRFIQVFDNILYIWDNSRMVVWDEATEQVIGTGSRARPERHYPVPTPPLVPNKGRLLAQSPYGDHLVYFPDGPSGQVWTFDPTTNTSAPVLPSWGEIPVEKILATAWIRPSSGSRAGRDLFEVVTTSGEVAFYDPQDGQWHLLGSNVEGEPHQIRSLGVSPDGLVCVGGYQGGLAIYDEVGQEYSVKASPAWQTEGFGFLGSDVYAGAYTGAKIWRFDPAVPWQDSGSNPTQVYSVNNQQDRPFAFASAGDMLYVGTTPVHGVLGGTLSCYDSTSDAWTTWTDVVPDQSVISLVAHNDLLIGGTGIQGGLGSTPTATSAVLFSWSMVSNEVVDTWSPAVPGLSSVVALGGLVVGPDGLLWCGAFGFDSSGVKMAALFAADLSSHAVERSTVLYPGVNFGDGLHAWFMAFGLDGRLYTNLGDEISVFEPDTLQLSKPNGSVNAQRMALGHDGSIYFTKNGTELFVLPALVGLQDLIDAVSRYRDDGVLGPILFRKLIRPLRDAQHFYSVKNAARAAAARGQFVAAVSDWAPADAGERSAKTSLLVMGQGLS